MPWLIDWDLPTKIPQADKNRVYFSRAVKKIMAELNGDTIIYSTMSVIVTSSRKLAEAIYMKAVAHQATRASLYHIRGMKPLKQVGLKPVTPVTA